jgi:hypothetical protein
MSDEESDHDLQYAELLGMFHGAMKKMASRPEGLNSHAIVRAAASVLARVLCVEPDSDRRMRAVAELATAVFEESTDIDKESASTH